MRALSLVDPQLRRPVCMMSIWRSTPTTLQGHHALRWFWMIQSPLHDQNCHLAAGSSTFMEFVLYIVSFFSAQNLHSPSLCSAFFPFSHQLHQALQLPRSYWLDTSTEKISGQQTMGIGTASQVRHEGEKWYFFYFLFIQSKISKHNT